MMQESQIILNRTTYPLYVGGRADHNFQDWKEKGSSVLMAAEVVSEKYDGTDLVWSIENPEIADFVEVMPKKQEATEEYVRIEVYDLNWDEEISRGAVRVRAMKTGVTKVIATLPDGTNAHCTLTVIDNYSRLTVREIVLNTNMLYLQEGQRTQLLPQVYPKDIYENGMLNTELIWQSLDESVAAVKAGKVIARGNGETDIVVSSADVDRKAVCHVVVGECLSGSTPAECVTYISKKPCVCGVTEQQGGGDKMQELENQKLLQPLEMQVGESLQLPHREGLVWCSEDRYTVSVDTSGCATACSPSVKHCVSERGLEVWQEPDVVTIYATETEGGAVTRYFIIVKPTEDSSRQIAVMPHDISISPNRVFLPVGKSRKITAAGNISIPHSHLIRWESSNPEILEVTAVADTVYGTAQAEVCAKTHGEAVVTAILGEKRAECSVCVTEGIEKVETIYMEALVEIDVDQVYHFHPQLPENATDKRLYWLTSDSKVATLDREGNVQGYRCGESKIYAIAGDSLSTEQRKLLEQLYADKVTAPGNEIVQELLSDTVHAECVLRVREDSVVLRNLHVVEEATTDHSVLLLWSRASLLDTGDFEKYVVRCNGKIVAETEKLGYCVENLTPFTNYHFQVQAANARGEVLCTREVEATTKEESEIINVLEYGAVGDGKRTETYFIQKAIDACPKGGTVLLPEHYVFVSGALFLKSDMTLQVDGILMGSIDPKDYPRVITKWEGWRKLEQPAEQWANSSEMLPNNHCPYASLLNAGCYEEGENSCTGPYNVENLVICGKGQINSNGFILAYNEGANKNTAKVAIIDYPVKDASSRGSAIRIHNGKNIYMKDVQVAYAPGWTIHTIYCEHITFDGMEVVSQGDGDMGLGTNVLNCAHIYNGDGIDPDSSVYVNIFNVFFTTGDDAVAMKSGRGKEGNELDKPLAYIRITDCVSKWSLGGFGTGSEVSAGAHDIIYQNLKMDGALISCIWIKSDVTRGGITENIQVRDVVAEHCNSPVWVFNTYAKGRLQVNPALRPTVVRHLAFENVHGKESNELGFRLEGSDEFMIGEVQLRGVSDGGKESRVCYCQNITIKP